MNSKGNGFKLAEVMAHQVLTNLSSLLPFKIEENRALCDRYEKLHYEVLACKEFVRVGTGGYEFVKGFNVADFDDELYLQLKEIAYAWNACPASVAIALVVLPRLIESGVRRVTSSPGGVEEVCKTRAVRINQILKERQRKGLFDYLED